jgi:hypothetical protein
MYVTKKRRVYAVKLLSYDLSLNMWITRQSLLYVFSKDQMSVKWLRIITRRDTMVEFLYLSTQLLLLSVLGEHEKECFGLFLTLFL